MFKTCFGGVLQLELSCHTAGGFSSGPLVWVERPTTTRPNPGANYCCHCLWTWAQTHILADNKWYKCVFWSLEDSPTPLLEVWGLSLVNPKLFLNICGYITYIHQSDQPWSPLAVPSGNTHGWILSSNKYTLENVPLIPEIMVWKGSIYNQYGEFGVSKSMSEFQAFFHMGYPRYARYILTER